MGVSTSDKMDIGKLNIIFTVPEAILEIGIAKVFKIRSAHFGLVQVQSSMETYFTKQLNHKLQATRIFT